MKGAFIFGVTKLALRLYCTVFLNLRVHGLGNVPRHTGAILVANHRSKLDGFLLYSLMDRMSYAFIKSDYFKNPFLRWYLKGGGGIPVKKGELRLSAIRDAKKALLAGGTLLVFPEGQINENGTVSLLPFETGFMRLALKYRVPVVPAVIIGTDRSLPEGTWIPKPSWVQVIVKEPMRFDCPVDSREFLDRCVNEVRNVIGDALRKVSPHLEWGTKGF
jgi:1-acyl-sn-glycerol-3-phosphate acyltransferase